MIMTRSRTALLATQNTMKKRISHKKKKQATTTKIKTNKPNKGQSSKRFTCGVDVTSATIVVRI
ncbi:hypothetical protein TSUD_127090 [Trifolium subterraneum]|nr:hypothetical protein TSUD_127090 [Trifolium subterraneum]